MTEIILDHKKGIKFSSDAPPMNNLQALHYLPQGILCLAQTVRAQEIQYSKKQTILYIGSQNPIVITAFDWFVISTTNYARIVGLIELMINEDWTSKDLSKNENHQKIKQHCDKYMKEVLPNISEWRNKVAAHPAATDPRKDDNVATIEYSLMQLITYTKPYFQVSAKWGTNGHSSQLNPWALTQVFEENLIPRFWPNMKLETIE